MCVSVPFQVHTYLHCTVVIWGHPMNIVLPFDFEGNDMKWNKQGFPPQIQRAGLTKVYLLHLHTYVFFNSLKINIYVLIPKQIILNPLWIGFSKQCIYISLFWTHCFKSVTNVLGFLYLRRSRLAKMLESELIKNFHTMGSNPIRSHIWILYLSKAN